jgi:peptide/nickel transport system substrate-binding protein
MQLTNSSSTFKAHLFRSSTELDPAEIKSAGQFIILSHLTKSLIKLNKYAEIEGDLLHSWDIQNNHTKFNFKIKKDIHFSDGTKITVSDIVNNIKRQVKLNTATHFDFTSIKSIKEKDETNFTIELKKKNIFLIEQLAYPEFGILHKSDIDRKSPSLKVSSGNYYLKSITKEKIELTLNSHAKDSSASAPKNVEISFFNPKTSIKEFKEGNLDFIAVPPVPGLEDFIKKYKVKKEEIFHPHIGYTYWLSINPNSKKLSTIENRHFVQNLVSKSNLSMTESPLFWTKAKQLYLPDGPGRPSWSSIETIWNKIDSLKKPNSFPSELSILSLNSEEFTSDLINSFKSSNIKINVTYSKTIKEFHSENKKREFDLLFVNNDFSNANLLGNLKVAFNQDHPLILVKPNEGYYKSSLENAAQNEDPIKRNNIFIELGLKLLEDGLIAPVAYNKIIFLHKKEVSLKNWSSLYPEVALWKIHQQKN